MCEMMDMMMDIQMEEVENDVGDLSRVDDHKIQMMNCSYVPLGALGLTC